jgi:hypothetical protein
MCRTKRISSLQIGLITVLSCLDGLIVLVQHPEWFQ